MDINIELFYFVNINLNFYLISILIINIILNYILLCSFINIILYSGYIIIISLLDKNIINNKIKSIINKIK